MDCTIEQWVANFRFSLVIELCCESKTHAELFGCCM